MSQKREAIKKAFMEMIREMPIEDIRTEELLKKAAVSKSTFYRLFRDKYEVMSSVYMDVSSSLVQEDPSLSNWKEWTRHDFANVQKNKAFFRGVISYEGQNSLRETVRSFYRENILRQVYKDMAPGQISEKTLFLVEALAEMNAFTLIWWIRNDLQPDPEQMVEYILACIPPSLQSYFEKKT